MRRVRLVCTALLVIGLVSGAIVSGVAPAVAQPEVPSGSGDDGGSVPAGGGNATDEGNESSVNLTDEQAEELPDYISEEEAEEALAESNDDNSSGAGPSSDLTGGGTEQIGGGFGGGGASAGGLMDGIAEWITEASVNFTQMVLEGTMEIVIGTPTPENAGWLGLFGEPTNEPFATLFSDLYETWLFPISLSFFAIAALIGASVLPFSGMIGRYTASKWVVTAFASILAIALSWPLVTLMHMLSDTVAMAIAPSIEQLTETEQGIQTIGTGAGTTAAAIYLTTGTNMVIYALIYGMRYFLLLMVMPYVFGLALAVSVFAPWAKLRAFGSMVIWQHVGLLIMSWPAALLFRAAYAIEWDFGVSGLASLLMTVGATVSAVAIPIVIAYQMTRMAGSVRGAAMGAGAAMAARSSYAPKSARYAKRAGSRARDIGQSAYSRAGSAKGRVKAAGDNSTSTSDANTNSRSATRGQPSSRSQSRPSTGGTQAERKRKTVHDMIQRRNRKANRPSRGAD